jgi:Cu2+-containing amine oxidase
VIINNAICIHEEDAGLLWKHADYRVGGRLYSICSHRLVVSMVCTLSKYGTTAGYGSPENFAGYAFQVHNRMLRRINEGVRTWDASSGRRWGIVSAGKRHLASGQLTGYSIGVKGGATVTMLWLDGYWVGQPGTCVVCM